MTEYRIAATLKEKEEIYKLRYRVFCQEKQWLNQNDYPDGKEIDEYDEHSVHFLAQKADEIVGTTRIIFPSDLDLPIVKNFEITISDHVERYVELSRLVVAKKVRGLEVIVGLLCSVLDWGLSEGITHGYAIVEEKLIRFLARLGYPFHKLGQGKVYFGAYTIPTCAVLAELSKTLQTLTLKRDFPVEIFIP